MTKGNIIRRWAFGGIAAAGLLAGGGTAAAVAATTASAAPLAATTMAYQAPHVVQLQGPNKLQLVFDGTTYTYNVVFHTYTLAPGIDLIQGTLHDGYEPVPVGLHINGVQFGKDVVFSVSYPVTGADAGNQGVRTFSGVIGPHGAVAGSYSETGTEAGAGTWSLEFPA